MRVGGVRTRDAVRRCKGPTFAISFAVIVMACGFVAASENHEGPNTTDESLNNQANRILIPTPAELERETLLANPLKRREALLWLARCIYSESSKAHEQELVGWVVRNRVETRYRGRKTYRRVVLDPYQFSAFNPDSENRSRYTSLNFSNRSPEWLQALEVAANVLHADPSERPFPETTRHFYSEQSLGDAFAPEWSEEQVPVRLTSVSIDARRFRFYDGVN